MLGEAHKGMVQANVLFGLLRKTVQIQGDMKLLVTLATLDGMKPSQYFSEAPIFTIPECSKPKEILYPKEPKTEYQEASLITVMQIHLTDLLVLLTQKEERDMACKIPCGRQPKPSTSKEPDIKRHPKKKLQEPYPGFCQPSNPTIWTMLDEDDMKVPLDILKEQGAVMPSPTAGQEEQRDDEYWNREKKKRQSRS
ncbi:ATP-dependent RNA helicase DHX8 [Fukomys damarensis]|uniref:ATP-dependent RNA helicase DHX8 n=1 Tax=Fukomys damarensis TaxID=885580 RepID=A0A091DXQ1_FUKDA|nr:ATP-dependent RNA helicase DHX8 [Fukomys damarensis]